MLLVFGHANSRSLNSCKLSMIAELVDVTPHPQRQQENQAGDVSGFDRLDEESTVLGL
jgi:hypothetical protein